MIILKSLAEVEKLADANKRSIIEIYNSQYDLSVYNEHFGDGHASEKIVEIIRRNI